MEVVKFKNRIRTQTGEMTPEGRVDLSPTLQREMHVQLDGMNTGDDSNSPYTSTTGRRYDNSRQICCIMLCTVSDDRRRSICGSAVYCLIRVSGLGLKYSHVCSAGGHFSLY
jgi:hypothetical protein